MTFCSSPFSRMTVGPDGSYRTCCYHPQVASGYGNVIDAFYGTEMDRLRERMLAGDHIKECEQCYEYDRIGELSQRAVINAEHPYEGKTEVVGLEMSYGNLCNMACVTCKPESSSVWEQRLGPVEKGRINYDGIDWSGLTSLSLTGGEPTIQKEFSPEFFRMLSRSLSTNCFFSMNTNCSKWVHKEWEDFVRRQKRVNIMLSLDGVGEVGEWIRPGMKQDIWEKNALRWKDLLKDNENETYGDLKSGVVCNFTLTNFSLWNIHETESYLNDLGIPIRWTNCNYPEMLSPEYLPDGIKGSIPDHPFVNKVLPKGVFNRQHCREFIEYVEYLSKFSEPPNGAKYIYKKLKKMCYFT